MKYYKRNTFTLMATFLGLLVFVGILIWVPGAFDTPLGRYYSMMATFILIVPLLNSLFQNLMILNVKRSRQFFFSGQFNEKPFYELVICLSAIVLLPLIPGVKLLEGSSLFEMGLHMGIWVSIAFGSIWVSYKTVAVDFYSDVIAVKGVNFFKSAGLSQRSMTATGIYEYTDFETYRVESNGFTLLLTDQRGQIRLKLGSAPMEPIEAFLKAKGIKRV